MIVAAYNPETKTLERTYLSQYTPEGSSSLAVKNTNNFSSSNKIMVGRMGDERTEMLTTGTITAPNTVALSGGNTQFAHNGDDPVYFLRYDKIRFYRASSIDGSYSLVDTVDIDVDNADKITRYDDPAGTGTDYYKIKYYNSVTTESSDYSDPIAAGGYARKTIGKVIERAAKRVRDTNYTILNLS